MSDVPRPFRMRNDDGTVTATGAEFPSGTLRVEWRREAFPSDQRSDEPIESRYESVGDAELASQGTVEFVGEEEADDAN